MDNDLTALIIVCIIGFFLIYHFSPNNTINWEILGWILIGTAAFMAVEWYTDIIYEDDDNVGGKLLIEGGGDEHNLIDKPDVYGGEMDTVLDNIVDM